MQHFGCSVTVQGRLTRSMCVCVFPSLSPIHCHVLESSSTTPSRCNSSVPTLHPQTLCYCYVHAVSLSDRIGGLRQCRSIWGHHPRLPEPASSGLGFFFLLPLLLLLLLHLHGSSFLVLSLSLSLATLWPSAPC